MTSKQAHFTREFGKRVGIPPKLKRCQDLNIYQNIAAAWHALSIASEPA